MKNSADLGGCYPPRPSASVDNTLLYLQNSSYPTQPHSIIANYNSSMATYKSPYKSSVVTYNLSVVTFKSTYNSSMAADKSTYNSSMTAYKSTYNSSIATCKLTYVKCGVVPSEGISSVYVVFVALFVRYV